MTIADHYFILINRIAELQNDISALIRAINNASSLNAATNAPSAEYIKSLKSALNNHMEHCKQLREAVDEMERAAGISN